MAELCAIEAQDKEQTTILFPELSKDVAVKSKPQDENNNKNNDDDIKKSIDTLSKEVKALKVKPQEPSPSNNDNAKHNDPYWSIFHTKSSLLQYHPIIEQAHENLTNTMNKTIEPYFQAYDTSRGDDIPKSISKFWIDSHTLSCIRQQSFTCTPSQVCSDFYVDDGSTSLCVNEALVDGTVMVDLDKVGEDEKDLILISSHDDKGSGIFGTSKNDDDAKIWNQSATYIGKQLKKRVVVNKASSQANAKETTNNKTESTTSTSYISSAMYGVVGIAKYMTSNISKGATYVLAKYDLADDPDEYGDITYDDNDYEDDDRQLEKKHTKLHYQLMNKDIVLNVPLVLKCCKYLLEHADQIITTSDDMNENSCGICHENKLLLHYGNAASSSNNIHSFRKFCQLAGKYQLDKKSLSSIESQCIGTFLQQISSSNSEFLMKVLLSSNTCQLKDNVIGIFPSTTNTESKDKLQNLTEIDVAIFKLTQTKSSLENRLSKLQVVEKHMTQKALQAKQSQNTKLALLYMKRRKNALQEIDHVASMLLNIEQGLESIHRSVNDREVAVAYQTCTSALKNIRTEGGLDDIDETIGDLKEEMDLVKDMSDAMNLGTMDAVEEHEIMQEFEAMEREIMQDEMKGLFPVVPQGVPKA